MTTAEINVTVEEKYNLRDTHLRVNLFSHLVISIYPFPYKHVTLSFKCFNEISLIAEWKIN